MSPRILPVPVAGAYGRTLGTTTIVALTIEFTQCFFARTSTAPYLIPLVSCKPHNGGAWPLDWRMIAWYQLDGTIPGYSKLCALRQCPTSWTCGRPGSGYLFTSKADTRSHQLGRLFLTTLPTSGIDLPSHIPIRAFPNPYGLHQGRLSDRVGCVAHSPYERRVLCSTTWNAGR